MASLPFKLGTPYNDVTPLDQLHQKLSVQGFAIVEDHRLSEEFCESAKDEVWQALETIVTSPETALIRRNDPSTYPNYFKLGPSHSMLLQGLGFTHLPSVWAAREKAAPIFASLWNVKPEELVSSMDGISFNIAPEKFPNDTQQGKYKGRTWWHTDQRLNYADGRCIQGFYNLCETGPNDGCLSVLEGSHKYHVEVKSAFYSKYPSSHDEVAEDWHLLTPREEDFYMTKKQCQWRFVCAPKGCFVIWDSRTIHFGAEPRLPRQEPRDRLVFYICMLPKMATSCNNYTCQGMKDGDVREKIEAFETHRTTTHYPYPVVLFDECQSSGVDPSRIPRMRLENMSLLQKSLLGI